MTRRAITRLALGAATMLACTAVGAGSAHADFGLERPPAVTFNQSQDLGFYDAFAVDSTGAGVKDGGFYPLVPDTTAGAHPDLSVDLAYNLKDNGADPPTQTDGSVRDVDVDLPAGFYGDPSGRPLCDPDRFFEFGGGGCTADSQVGVAGIYFSAGGPFAGGPAPIYLMRSSKDDTAVLAFAIIGIGATVELGARTEGDGGLVAKVRGITSKAEIGQVRLTLWGDPSDPKHDRLRYASDGTAVFDPVSGENTGTTSTFPSKPFLTAPARCDGPLQTQFRTRSWQRPNEWLTYSVQSAAPTGCDQLRFDPSFRATPSSPVAGQPTGLGADLDVPQTESIDERATPQVKDVRVKLPEGLAISPGGASGLAACADSQFDRGSRGPESCPDASRVGTATITTPVFDEKLEGSVYLGSQLSSDPASGDMYRLFVVSYARGIRIKLVGRVAADPVTGQLTATFAQNPQLPFSNLHLQLKDGPRALVVNPGSCGTSQVAFDASSYAGSSVSKQSDFAVNQGCDRGRVFGPSFSGGTVDPVAARFSPFVTAIGRSDDQADLSGVRIDLPPGLLGAVGSVPRCAEAQAAAGTCPASTRVGSTRVAVGTGAAPFSLPGAVYLGGPYKGAPFSLSIVVRALAGPLDLGTVVVRSPLVVDANNAKVSAPVDPLPQIVGGVPLHYRSINVNLDRPGFTFNATNCSASRLASTFTSTARSSVRTSVNYQAQRCSKLRFAPKLKLGYSGAVKKGANPKLTASLSQGRDESNLEQVRVTLPAISSLRPENADTLCQPEQAARRACPKGSMVGKAAARTPALPGRLAGPVYLVQGFRTNKAGRRIRTLPGLYAKLDGSGVGLDLNARSSVVGGKRLAAKFTAIPDAPVSAFRLEIDGGRKGILTAVKDPCRSDRTADVGFLGQNRKRLSQDIKMSVRGCKR